MNNNVFISQNLKYHNPNSLCELSTLIYILFAILMILNIINFTMSQCYNNICLNKTNTIHTNYIFDDLNTWLIVTSTNNLLFTVSFFCLMCITKGNCSSFSAFTIKITCVALFCYLITSLISIIFGWIILLKINTLCYPLFVISIICTISSILSFVTAFVIFLVYFVVVLMINGFKGDFDKLKLNRNHKI